jgi:hypothetical protein
LLVFLVVASTRVLAFTETTALIVASVCSIPLLFVALPVLRSLLQNVSSIKLGDWLEIGLKGKVEQVASASAPPVVGVAFLDERMHVQSIAHVKGAFEELQLLIEKQRMNPSAKIVLTVELEPVIEPFVQVSAIYFQSRVLQSVFDFRAVLFVRRRERPISASDILGTIPPSKLLALLESELPILEETFCKTIRPIREKLINPALLDESWHAYLQALREREFIEPAFEEYFISKLVDRLEKHVVDLSSVDTESLLRTLESPFHQVVFLKDGTPFVRTLASLARDLFPGLIRQLRNQAEAPERRSTR